MGQCRKTCDHQSGETVALIACKECGKVVSTRAVSCPHCGARTAYAANRFGWVLVACLTAGVAGVLCWQHNGDQKRAADAATRYREAIEASERFQDSAKP